MYLHERAAALDGDSAPRHDEQGKPGLDPRARLLCAAGCAVGVSLAASLTAAALWCALGFTALLPTVLGQAADRTDGRRVRAGLLSVNAFMLAVWCTLPLTLPWPEAAALASLLTLKANAALFFLLALCSGLSLAQAASALHALGLPPTLVTLFLLTCRHLHDLRQDFAVSLQALRLRVPAPHWRRALYLYACLLCSVLVRANDKATALRMALTCRLSRPGYQDRHDESHSFTSALPRALYGRLHWSWRETGLCALSLLLCLLTALNPFGDHLAQALARL